MVMLAQTGYRYFTDRNPISRGFTLSSLKAIIADHDATEAQVALAWVLATKPYLIPIPGSRKVERLRQNARASELSLTAGEMQAINAELVKSDLLVFGGHKAR